MVESVSTSGRTSRKLATAESPKALSHKDLLLQALSRIFIGSIAEGQLSRHRAEVQLLLWPQQDMALLCVTLSSRKLVLAAASCCSASLHDFGCRAARAVPAAHGKRQMLRHHVRHARFRTCHGREALQTASRLLVIQDPNSANLAQRYRLGAVSCAALATVCAIVQDMHGCVEGRAALREA